MVTLLRTSPLLLLLITWVSLAEESSTVLIDNTRGIDRTLGPAATELKDLAESLKNADDSEYTENIEKTSEKFSDTSPESSSTPLSEPTILIDNTKGIDTLDAETSENDYKKLPENAPALTSEPVILIDKIKGIDTIANPEIKDIKDISESLKDTGIIEPTTALKKPEKKPVVAQPETIPPSPAPEKSAGSKLLPTLPKVVETEEQKTLTIEGWTPNNNDLRILEIRIEQYKLEDVLPAYQFEDVVLIPIGALTELLDLAITVKPGLAEGFIFNEQWTFMLDTTRAEIVLQGIPDTYDRSLVHDLEDDIYVESNLLSKWMLMTFDIDLFSASIRISSEEKLPLIKRIEREKRIASSLARLNKEQEVYPRHHEPYQNWSTPFIDQTLRTGLLKNDSETNLTYQSTTYVTSDLLEHEASLYVTINDQDGFDDVRFTLGRTDPEGELLGFMKANEYSLGHVNEPRIDLITISGSQELGASVSNYPIGRQTEYDRHRFRGDLLPGWEVELYQNNSLIGYQPGAIEGQYDFPDIPLLFGSNHFRLVFYGPQGQIREKTQNFELSQSLTKKGQHYYSATASQDETDGNRLTAQYDYGIKKSISSSFALANIPLQDGLEREQHTYIKAGLRGFWDAFLGTIDIIDDSAGGSAVDLSLQTRVDSTVFIFNNTTLSNFFSEEFKPSEIELTQRTNFGIDTAIPPSFLPRIPLSLNIKRDTFVDGGNLLEITNRLSTNVRGFAISNFLRHQSITDQDNLFTGTAQLSTRVSRMSLRGSVSYEFQPDTELTSLAVTLDPGQYKDYRLSFGITHSLEQDVTDLSASANKLTGKYNLSFGARVNTDSEISLDVALSIGIGHEPRRNQWHTNARTIANQGSVSARVFIDSNQDGIYDENDEPLEGVGFRLNGGYNQERTAEDGIVFLTGLPAYEPMNVVISPETLVDPLWTAALEGIQVTPRPGKAILLDFPVFVSGEVDGTVYLSRNGKEFGVGNVTLELVNDDNRVLNTTETAYDGFYIMENVPLGSYRLRISQKQLQKLELRAKTEETISISADDLFVNGVDFNLVPQ